MEDFGDVGLAVVIVVVVVVVVVFFFFFFVVGLVVTGGGGGLVFVTSMSVDKVSRTGSIVVNLLPLNLSTTPSLSPSLACAVMYRNVCTWFQG